MQPRIKIKHAGPRGWAGIVRSAFDPEVHEVYTGDDGSKKEPTSDNAPDGDAAPEIGAQNAVPDEITALRAEYESLYGKRPFMGWDEAKLREKIAEVKA